jgi:hypothetical protein
MDHAQFHEELAKIANGRYFSTQVKASTHTTGATEVVWQGYIDGLGWSNDHANPDGVIAELSGEYAKTTIKDLGRVPDATQPKASPPAEQTETDNLPPAW